MGCPIIGGAIPERLKYHKEEHKDDEIKNNVRRQG